MSEHAARLAVVVVALDVRVTCKLEAEQAVPAELRELVRRDPESVLGAVLARVGRPGRGEAEAGWLDESRAAFVTEVLDAERTQPWDVPGWKLLPSPEVVA